MLRRRGKEKKVGRGGRKKKERRIWFVYIAKIDSRRTKFLNWAKPDWNAYPIIRRHWNEDYWFFFLFLKIFQLITKIKDLKRLDLEWFFKSPWRNE